MGVLPGISLDDRGTVVTVFDQECTLMYIDEGSGELIMQPTEPADDEEARRGLEFPVFQGTDTYDEVRNQLD